ncbi:MAG: hypothetical protein LUF87_11500 [Alistipes sp.]|nr:hypothetical protein [Alistipes sp.]
MKKFCLLTTVAMLMLASCSDDDLNGLGAFDSLTVRASQVRNAPADGTIDAVKLIAASGSGEAVLASSGWDDGFTLNFPLSVSSLYLDDIETTFGIRTADLSALTVTEPGAGLRTAYIQGYRNEAQDNYFYQTNSSTDSRTIFIYTDRQVKVYGNAVGDGTTYEFDLWLFKGWNRIVQTISQTEGQQFIGFMSTQPSGLFWIYDDL